MSAHTNRAVPRRLRSYFNAAATDGKTDDLRRTCSGGSTRSSGGVPALAASVGGSRGVASSLAGPSTVQAAQNTPARLSTRPVGTLMMVQQPQVRDYIWAAIAIVVLVLLGVSVVAILLAVALGGVWSALLSLPIGALFYWWIGVGAWRRTVWARRSLGSRSNIESLRERG